jgi:hypothetical protein
METFTASPFSPQSKSIHLQIRNPTHHQLTINSIQNHPLPSPISTTITNQSSSYLQTEPKLIINNYQFNPKATTSSALSLPRKEKKNRKR